MEEARLPGHAARVCGDGAAALLGRSRAREQSRRCPPAFAGPGDRAGKPGIRRMTGCPVASGPARVGRTDLEKNGYGELRSGPAGVWRTPAVSGGRPPSPASRGARLHPASPGGAASPGPLPRRTGAPSGRLVARTRASPCPPEARFVCAVRPSPFPASGGTGPTGKKPAAFRASGGAGHGTADTGAAGRPPDGWHGAAGIRGAGCAGKAVK